MILIGILSATALPRLSALGTFAGRGFRDQTIATLRFAQKTAIAQRRAVCVTTSSSAVTLEIAATSSAASGCGGAALNLPFTAKAGTGLSVASFNFKGMGETDAASDITLTVTDADNITVDHVTGYVR